MYDYQLNPLHQIQANYQKIQYALYEILHYVVDYLYKKPSNYPVELS